MEASAVNFLNNLLIPCLPSHEAVEAIHDRGLVEWKTVLKCATVPGQDQDRLIMKAVACVGGKVAMLRRREKEIVEKQKVILGMTFRDHKFLKQVLVHLVKFGEFEEELHMLGCFLTYLYLFCESVLDRVANFDKRVYQAVVQACRKRIEDSGLMLVGSELRRKFVELEKRLEETQLAEQRREVKAAKKRRKKAAQKQKAQVAAAEAEQPEVEEQEAPQVIIALPWKGNANLNGEPPEPEVGQTETKAEEEEIATEIETGVNRKQKRTGSPRKHLPEEQVMVINLPEVTKGKKKQQKSTSCSEEGGGQQHEKNKLSDFKKTVNNSSTNASTTQERSSSTFSANLNSISITTTTTTTAPTSSTSGANGQEIKSKALSNEKAIETETCNNSDEWHTVSKRSSKKANVPTSKHHVINGNGSSRAKVSQPKNTRQAKKAFVQQQQQHQPLKSSTKPDSLPINLSNYQSQPEPATITTTRFAILGGILVSSSPSANFYQKSAAAAKLASNNDNDGGNALDAKEWKVVAPRRNVSGNPPSKLHVSQKESDGDGGSTRKWKKESNLQSRAKESFENWSNERQASYKKCKAEKHTQKSSENYADNGYQKRMEVEARRKFVEQQQEAALRKILEQQQLQLVEPPEDFHQLSIIPSLDELTQTKKPFLRPNLIVGEYRNAHHYLDVHYRLLREDFVRPLRRAVQTFIKERDNLTNPSALKNLELDNDVRLYPNVIYSHRESSDNTAHYLFDLNSTRRINWSKSRRLLPGSLVMLTPDMGNTAFFAVTVLPPFDSRKNRNNPPAANLDHTRQELMTGTLRLKIESGEFSLKPGKQFMMIECESYFESYRHNLATLQKVTFLQEEYEMPLTKYILGHCKSLQLPEYFSNGNIGQWSLPVDTEEIEIRVNPLASDNWDADQIQTDMHLDKDQYIALKTALTSQLSVIQGPPGTGKTFVGLQIAKTIIYNKRIGTLPDFPILVLCYTNHALDQFLELLLDDMPNIRMVRVGGQCKTETLRQYTLQEHKKRLRMSGRKMEISVPGSDVPFSIREKYFDAMSERAERPKFDLASLDARYTKLDIERREMANPNGLINFRKMLVGECLRYMLPAELWNCMNSEMWLGVSPGVFQNPRFYLRTMLARCFTLKSCVLERFGVEEVDEQQVDGETQSKSSEEEGDEDTEENFEFDLEELLEHRYTDGDFSNSNSNKHRAKHYKNIYFPLSSVDGCKQRINQNIDLVRDLKDKQQDMKLYKAVKLLVREQENRISFLEAVFALYQKGELGLPDISHMISKFPVCLDNGQVYNNYQFHIQDIHFHPLPVRWAFYFAILLVAKELVQRLLDELVGQQLTAKGIDQRFIQDGCILGCCDVIGMTTTGAAKMHDLLEIAKPEIVIVEEAAEILEAHVITSLTKHCQQLILIGDHKQLQPKVNVFDLCRNYNLNISLFERMIHNGVPWCMLKTQHRMQPDIAKLIVGPIYKELSNHPDVYQYPKIKGVSKHLYFLKHREPEDTDMDINSKINAHEAGLVVEFCKYLLRQGYAPRNITVLTTYTGQMFLIKRHFPPRFNGVRVTCVDNYQGEENDIILLSLVRSNPKGVIGFLGIANRICVALSRAKHGMFVFGNMDCLLNSGSKFWKHINWQLKQMGCIGHELELICERHQNKTRVRDWTDFEKIPSSGCTQICNGPLPCGHKCPFKCHAHNPEHAGIPCEQQCLKTCAIGHRCMAKCNEPCPPCRARVRRPQKCGHLVLLPCIYSENSNIEFKCTELVWKTLQCRYNHLVKAECYRDVRTIDCPELVVKDLPCGHTKRMECGKPVKTVKCFETIQTALACGHFATLPCSEDARLVNCPEMVDKRLPCGHIQRARCSVHPIDVECRNLIKVLSPKCGHWQYNVRCSNQANHKCPAKCEEALVCGHFCRLDCHKDKDPHHQEYECKERKCNRKCELGHTCDFSHECFRECPPCRFRTTEVLDCGHEQEVECASKINGQSQCMEMVRRTLPCGHDRRVFCYMKAENHKCTYLVTNCEKICKEGHLCGSEHPCYKECPPCQEKTIKNLPCEHTVVAGCSEEVFNIKCKEKVRKKCTACGLMVKMNCWNDACRQCEEEKAGGAARGTGRNRTISQGEGSSGGRRAGSRTGRTVSISEATVGKGKSKNAKGK